MPIHLFVQAARISITDFLSGVKNNVLLDVRSPSEYNHAHIPGAISFPLFTDEERKIVGTAYKQESREKAIKIGLDFFAPKMRKMVEEVEAICNRQYSISNGTTNFQLSVANCLFVYCWRGGMRSGVVSWLLNFYGFNVYTMAGGYKAYRNHVLKTFEQPFNLKILGGYTGSGKTEVLNELIKNGEAVIDLEKLASHKGSAFGSLNMPAQPTQEMFENYLAEELTEKTMVNKQVAKDNLPASESNSLLFTHYSSIWLEDESQRIGNLNIPGTLWQKIRSSPVFFLEIPFEERLNYIVEEYGDCSVQQLIDATNRIAKRLGPLETKNTILFFESGNIKEAFRILLHYYDKHYLKGLHNRQNVATLVTKVACEKVTTQNAKSLLTKHQTA